ncbi:MAG: hypothetical protein ACRCUP_07970 [Mycoplasmatales bacterium]
MKKLILLLVMGILLFGCAKTTAEVKPKQKTFKEVSTKQFTEMKVQQFASTEQLNMQQQKNFYFTPYFNGAEGIGSHYYCAQIVSDDGTLLQKVSCEPGTKNSKILAVNNRYLALSETTDTTQTFYVYNLETSEKKQILKTSGIIESQAIFADNKLIFTAFKQKPNRTNLVSFDLTTNQNLVLVMDVTNPYLASGNMWYSLPSTTKKDEVDVMTYSIFKNSTQKITTTKDIQTIFGYLDETYIVKRNPKKQIEIYKYKDKKLQSIDQFSNFKQLSMFKDCESQKSTFVCNVQNKSFMYVNGEYYLVSSYNDKLPNTAKVVKILNDDLVIATPFVQTEYEQITSTKYSAGINKNNLVIEKVMSVNDFIKQAQK